ncbi:hypothetical protein SMA70_23145, partial [Escherichia coli]
VEQDDKGWDARKRAYCLKIQPATGSFARNLIYWGQFGYRKLLYVKLIFYHFWFFWKRNILDVKTVMRGH